jgi:hypothetical protein
VVGRADAHVVSSHRASRLAPVRGRSSFPVLEVLLAALVSASLVTFGTWGPRGAEPPARAAAAPGAADVAVRPVARPLVLPAPRVPVSVAEPPVAGPGPVLRPAAGEDVTDVPETAVETYRFAEVVLGASRADCRVPWTVLAAAARTASDHGRAGGRTLAEDGRISPRLLGPRRDPRRTPVRVRDTDGGRIDRDRLWDRPVGPFQLMPRTWRAYAVDGDDDGRRDPHDLDDAAVAFGLLLCSVERDVSRPAALRRAMRRLHPTGPHAGTVVRTERGYRRDVAAGVDLPEPPTVVLLPREKPPHDKQQ